MKKKKRNKKYTPNPDHNSIVQGKRLKAVGEQIKKLQESDKHLDNLVYAIQQSHDKQIQYLSNFARHDIKNAILSMDSILTVTSPDEFNEEKIQSLKAHLLTIKTTMESFAKVIPYTNVDEFNLEDLFIALETLFRPDMEKNKISFKINFQRKLEVKVAQSFQAIFQVLSNLIINSIKALENTESKKISIESSIKEELFKISISDNGIKIPKDKFETIFEYGYSTTKGSGIGLFHAKYNCEIMKGSIKVDLPLVPLSPIIGQELTEFKV